MYHARYTIQFVLLGLIMLIAIPAQASVTLKVSASNPSRFSERKVAIKSYLPRGIQPANVINAGGLEVGYDVKQGQCYVHKEEVLATEATVTYLVEIEDIWLIKEEELLKYRQYARDINAQLQASEYAEVSGKMLDGIEKKLESIVDRQEENLVDQVSPIEHVTAYEVNQEAVASVKEDIETMENMMITLLKAGAVATGQGGKPAAGGQRSVKEVIQDASPVRTKDFGVMDTPEGYEAPDSQARITELGQIPGAGCLSQEASRYARDKQISLEEPAGVVLKVTADNPSETEAQAVPVRYYLPEDVKSSDVVDAGELEVGFDFEKSVFYVFKDDVRLTPAEKRVFNITLKNKWYMDSFYMLTLKVQTDNMTYAMRESKSLPKVRTMNENIQQEIDALLERERGTELNEQYMAAFQEDVRKLKNIEQRVRDMEEMLVSEGIVVAMTEREKEMLCEEERNKKKITSASGAEGSEVLKEFKLVAGTVFKGKSPSTVVTWKLIYGIVVFLGVLSSSFYYIQIRAQKSTMLDPLTGVFSRGYITERFREELRIAKTTKTKCSLLVLDIDKFKGINDTHGHAVGDTIIREFVIAIRKGVRATDLVGRFGGDEFLIILPTGDKDRARRIAEGVNKTVEKHVVKIKNQTFNVTTSIGVATFPDDSGTAEDMFNKADNALYEVKRKGGNGVAAV